jgi:hypothetical protein
MKAPNYTQVPNDWLDVIEQVGTLGELKVTLAIFRQTFGFHQRDAQVTISGLTAATGLSRKSVIAGVEAAVARGAITRIEGGPRTPAMYGVAPWYEDAPAVEELHRSGGESTPPAVEKVHRSSSIGERKERKNDVDPEVERLWHAVLDRCPPAVPELTTSRQRTLRRALNEAPFELCVRALDGVVELHGQGKGELDWRRPLEFRPGRSLTDQIAWFASQATGPLDAHAGVLAKIHPNAATRLRREHADPGNEQNVELAKEIHDELARRGLRAVFEGSALKIEQA